VIGRSSVRLPFLLLLLAGLCACSQPLTLEQQIIATIREMEAKMEAGERRRFLGHISEDFTGQDGAMTREQVRALVVFQLNRHKSLQAQLFPIHVAESGEDTATADFRALVTGGPNWIPENGQVYDFETHWRLVDDEWYLYAANWTPVALDEVL
jgi:hypothetical protein